MLMDREKIKEYIPHREPFLFIDRVEELVENSHIVAYTDLTGDEYFLKGHFPNMPIMPGVITAEAMAQATAIMSSKTLMSQGKDITNLTSLLAGMDKVRFKHPILPGDSIKIELKLIRVRKNLWQYEGTASVEGKIACEAIINSIGVDKEKFNRK